ncbi:hypothetical protein LJC58_04675, partial [Lachnospiraceae bacterium OttesenSCG-928-D06]|nr:hypothetical protein [Lachnospiraceae bacterium OttesenSCG-928-D06]
GGLDFLMLITSLQDAEKVEKILQNSGLPLKYRCKGVGTANSEIMDVLGLSSNNKGITITLVPRHFRKRIIAVLTDELDLYKPGKGIIFSIPISGVSGSILNSVDSEAAEDIRHKMEDYMERGAKETMNNIEHSLVIAIVNRGFNEDVMDAAKKAGALGGTIMNGRRLGVEEVSKFFGVSVQSEKEIVAILVQKENRLELMRCIGENCGMESKAKGVVLSLPVDEVAGLGKQM